LAFVRKHFEYLLRICSFSLQNEPVNITAEEFNLLGILLSSGSNLLKADALLSDGVSAFSTQRTASIKHIRGLVDKNLVWNEELYPSIEPTVSTPLAPAPAGSRSLNINGVNRATWLQKPPTAGQIEFLNISSCTDTVVYFTSHVRFCLIAGCHDCTIILGAVSSLCTILNCEKVSVHVAAHCFKIDNSNDSSAYVYCHVPPILSGDTRGIKLAPFNVLCTGMDAALAHAGMMLESSHIDEWARPLCCTLGSPDETLGGRSASHDESTSSSYHFVHPKDFHPVVVPEQGAVAMARLGATLSLPQVYDDALKIRIEELRKYQRQLTEITNEEKRCSAQHVIQAHFKEWLHATGKSRQLADLARMFAPSEPT
jgi:hypothetical protein